jgi:predicted naringenin-chalcone synthase
MRDDGSALAILSIGTAVPRYRFTQKTIGNWMAESFPSQPTWARWLRGLYAAAGVETRYASIPDPGMPAKEARFSPGYEGPDVPGTAERMAIYQRESVALGLEAARRALADYSPHEPSGQVAASITHLIVISCTGFFAPGPDMTIARQLGLSPTVKRTLIGFMGCGAAFNGLRTAAQIVAAQPEARVLLICIEIGSIHIQPGFDRNVKIAEALFGDGSAACLVGAAPPDGRDRFALDAFHSEIVPDTAQEMVWSIGDYGFILRLSSEIARHLGEHAPRVLTALLAGLPVPQFWAVHPGGPAIVKRLAEVLHLRPEDVAPSFEILHDYGNMSSPTILFVLRKVRDRLRREGGNQPLPGVAMGFGPGLVIEMAHLTYFPALNPAPALTRKAYVVA